MTKRSRTTVIILFIIFAAFRAEAADEGGKSGVKPQVISLPSGPASIEGLGESFQPQLNTGTAAYSIPLKPPPTRGGAPEIALEYNSGYGNGPLGMGWRLNIPYIQRQTNKGLPLYQNGDSFIDWNGEELVLVDASGVYRSKNEAGFTEFRLVPDGYWKARLKDGTTLTFGGSTNERQERSPGQTFRWMLSREEDANGNRSEYTYVHDQNQIYISEIRYGQHATEPSSQYSIRFTYDTTRSDPVVDYHGRFRCVTQRRLECITLIDGSRRVRHYQLSYGNEHHSLLTEVKIFGDDRANLGSGAEVNKDFLPPLGLGYIASTAVSTPRVTSVRGAPVVSFLRGDAELVDINADGLPDILLDDQDGYQSALNQGEGKAWGALQGFNFSPASRLREATTALVDLRGDGKSKLFLQDQEGWYYLAFNSPQVFGSPITFTMPGFFPLDDPEVRLVDINNDKAIDLMATDADSFSFLINKDGGEHNYYLSNPPVPPAGVRFSQGWQLADMNGDGLQDLVLLGTQEEGGTVFHANMGWGAFDLCETMAGGPADADLGYSGIKGLFLTDVNGDGLADLVFVDSGVVKYWLNESGKRWGDRHGVTGDIPDYDRAVVAVRFADMNGNGSTDIVWNRTDMGPENALKYLDLRPGPKPFQLNRIENGIGGVTEIAYSTSTNFMVSAAGTDHEWTSFIPFPVDVVTSVTGRDGLGHEYRQEISYTNGYFDGNEKAFRGFAAAERREIGDASAPDLITAFVFDTGGAQEALKGKPLAVEARTASGEIFHRESYDWATRKLADGISGDVRDVTFPYQRTKVRELLEKGSGSPVQLKWEYDYDNYGNLTRKIEHGRMDTGWDDERVTEISYTSGFASGLSLWILDKVVEHTARDEEGTLVAQKRNYYDGSTTLGEVVKGNLTRVDDWVSPGKFVVSTRNDYDAFGNIIAIYDPLYGTQPGHYREIHYDDVYHVFPVQEIIHTGKDELPVLSISATYDYGFGVMTSSTDFNNTTTHYAYDTFARLTSITKPPDVGHTVEYDYVLAHKTSTGAMVNWVETRQRDGSEGDGFLHSRTFYDGMERKVMTRAEGEEPGQIVVSDTVRFNARKNPWKKYLPYFETGALDFVEPTFNTGFTEHFYDAQGREVRVNQPAGPEGILYSTTSYEPLSRTVRDEEQTRPDSPHFGCGMRYVEDGLQDDEGKGRLREVHETVKLSDTGEPLGTPVEWETAYSYDILGNFTGYTDSQLNRKIVVYDGLGRMTFMNDPDRGHMTYTYDDAGNLAKTVDAKGQVIRYAYDGVNRLLAEYYGEGKTTPDVEYHHDTPFGALDRGDLWRSREAGEVSSAILSSAPYDPVLDVNSDGKVDVADVVSIVRCSSPSCNVDRVTAQNTLGHVAWVKDQSGEEHNSYDARGRVQWTVKRIATTDAGTLRSFYSAMAYDSMDRMVKSEYPDRTFVTHNYNSRGLLESTPNVIQRVDYNPVGQNLLLELACGTVTSYDYDHRQRLSRLKTSRPRDGLTLQDLSYSYDGVSNITQILDGRSGTDLDTIGRELGLESAEARKFNGTQSFLYDSLYRLTQAANPNVYGTITYRYDRIGNMIQKNASLLEPDPLMDLGAMTSGGSLGTSGRIGRASGDPPGPHAITGTSKGPTGPLAFTYDANGNMATDDGASLFWDHKDRLVGFAKGSQSGQYTYDYTDSRKKKVSSDSSLPSSEAVVYYIDKLSEVRDGELLKYIYAGNNRIAQADTTPGPTMGIQPSLFYLYDHLGSTVLALKKESVVAEHLGHDPYGHRKLIRYAEGGTPVSHYGFIGKEQDLESTLYYFEARYYLDKVARFQRVDPLADHSKSLWLLYPQKLNLYSYANNRPLNMLDSSGMDVVLLNDQSGVYGFGHNGVLVGNDKTGWTYFQKSGENPKNDSPTTFDTLSDFQNDPASDRYNRGFRVATSKEQDTLMINKGKEIINRPYHISEIPSPIYGKAENCADLTWEIGSVGNLNIDKPKNLLTFPLTITVPNKQYEFFKQNNQGTEINLRDVAGN